MTAILWLLSLVGVAALVSFALEKRYQIWIRREMDSYNQIARQTIIDVMREVREERQTEQAGMMRIRKGRGISAGRVVVDGTMSPGGRCFYAGTFATPEEAERRAEEIAEQMDGGRHDA